jgi:hypothetical protein
MKIGGVAAQDSLNLWKSRLYSTVISWLPNPIALELGCLHDFIHPLNPFNDFTNVQSV